MGLNGVRESPWIVNYKYDITCVKVLWDVNRSHKCILYFQHHLEIQAVACNGTVWTNEVCVCVNGCWMCLMVFNYVPQKNEMYVFSSWNFAQNELSSSIIEMIQLQFLVFFVCVCRILFSLSFQHDDIRIINTMTIGHSFHFTFNIWQWHQIQN